VSDTSGLPNADAQGVPAEDDPERFEQGAGDGGRDAQAEEPAETEPGQGDDGHGSGDTGRTAPEGAEDVTDAQTQNAPAQNAPTHGSEGAEPPPADFDPAQQPSNPDMVKNVEPPD
jgi:hypothetical protein